jgi:hypothetical protein
MGVRKADPRLNRLPKNIDAGKFRLKGSGALTAFS